jgi:hypothetical protein
MTKKGKAPESGKLTVKGLGRVIMSTHNATVANAKAVRKAMQQAGVPGMHVVVPGEMGKPPKFNKRKSAGRSSPE